MLRRPFASVAAGGALALALLPATAHASTASARVSVRGGHAAAAPAAVTYRSVSPRDTNGITPAFDCTTAGALTFDCTASATDANGATISSYTFDFGDGNTATNTTGTTSHTYTSAGTYTTTVTFTDSTGATATATESVTTIGSDYTAYGPTRILDTRNGTGEASAAAIASDSSIKLKIAGNGTIPTGVTAVVINLTAVDQTANGVISAYPDGGSRPSTSNLNYFSANGAVAALATVQVGADGYIDLYNNSSGTVDLIGDVSGYYTQTSASGFTPLTPARILDTRSTVGGHDGALAADSSLSLTVAGADSGLLPSSGITAVAVNLTTTAETANGALTGYPDGSTRSSASNLNYRTGINVANYAVVPVGSDGKIDIYNNSTGTTDVIADVTGYFSASSTSSYVPVTPTRSLDTRTLANGTVQSDGNAQDLALTSIVNNATAYAITATVVDTTANGNLIIHAAASTLPTTSNIDWTTDATVANSAYIVPGTTGIYFYNQSSGTTDVIDDEYGYFSNQ